MKYIKELEHTRVFHDRTRLLKQLLKQEKQIEEQKTYIKQLETLLDLHDLSSTDMYNLTKDSMDDGVNVNVRKFFNHYEILHSQKQNTKD